MAPQTNPHELLKTSIRILTDAGVPSPQVDARAIFESVLNKPPYMWPSFISEGAAREIESLIGKRASRVPLQHVLGKMWFLGLELVARPGVFSVRPETEVLAQWAIDQLRDTQAGDNPRVLDLCTGSGALALAVAHAHPEADVTAIELSAPAIQVARENAETHELPVRFIHGDALEFRPELEASCDLVISNPPYVPPRQLDPELNHDPQEALWGGGEDGLDFLRDLIPLCAKYAKPGAHIGIEHDDTQGEATQRLAQNAGLTDIHTLKDLAGRDRFLVARRPEVKEVKQ